MKLSRTFIFIYHLPLFLLAGCSWDSSVYDTYVDKDGELVRCPPEAGQASLSFIHLDDDKSTVCHNDDSDAIECSAYGDAFKYGLCPVGLDCVLENGLYGCSKTIIEKCSENAISCLKDDGSLRCLDPSSRNTCGATDCENRGKQCKDKESCVQNNFGSYICTDAVKCQEGAITCQDADGSLLCIDGKSKNNCGATDCDNPGTKCESNESCTLGSDGNYACTNAVKCQEGAISCQAPDGSLLCIDHKTKDYCGAVDCDNRGTACKDTESCVPDADGNYHCENAIVEKCQSGLIECKNSDGSLLCIDNKTKEYCGAVDCDSKGTACKDTESCIPDAEGKYHCENSIVEKCQNGLIECKNSDGSLLCIDNKTKEYCGAVDCDNKGTMCKDTEACVPDADGKYHCEISIRCPDGLITCSDKDNNLVCIDPTYYLTCGAVSCDDTGHPCNSATETCDGKACQCKEGLYRCGDECHSPSENDYCGISEDCEENAAYEKGCKPDDNDNIFECRKKDGNYQCELTECAGEANVCSSDTGPTCISKSDNDNCEYCGLKCSEQKKLNATGDKCEKNEDKNACTYHCNEGFTQCGDEFEPVCVDTQTNIEHCGECNNKCAEGQKCQNKICRDTTCKVTECSFNDNCVNNDNACGPNCDDCTASAMTCDVNTGTCVPCEGAVINNRCQLCGANQHVSINRDACENNSVNACGPSTLDGTVSYNAIVKKCDLECISNNSCTNKCEDSQCCITGNIDNNEELKDITCCEGYSLYYYEYNHTNNLIFIQCNSHSHYGCFTISEMQKRGDGKCWERVTTNQFFSPHGLKDEAE